MPGGTRSVFRARFSAKKKTTNYISRQKGDYYYIKTRHNDLFFPLQSFSRETWEKLACKSRVITDASISNRAHAPWASHNTP